VGVFPLYNFRFRSPASMLGGKEKSRPHAPLAPMRNMHFYFLLKCLNGRVVLSCSFHLLADVRGVGYRAVERKLPPQIIFFKLGDLSALYRTNAKKKTVRENFVKPFFIILNRGSIRSKQEQL
jgi:hypothetical protein